MKRLLAAIVAMSFAACAPEKPEIISRTVAGEDAQVVMVVEDESFTLDEVKQRLDTLPEWAAARFSTTERKKAFVAVLVQFELLHDDAERKGYQNDPAAIHQFEKSFVDAWLDEQVDAQPITSEQVAAHFEEHIDRFRRGEARIAYILQAPTKERAETLRERIVAESESPVVDRFRDVAGDFSLDFPSRKNGGFVGAVSQNGEFVAADDTEFYRVNDDTTGPFHEVVWSLEEGVVSEPTEMAGRWLLVVWSGTVPPEDVEAEDVADEVRVDIQKARRAELVEKYES